MATSDIIAAVAAGETVTKAKRVGKGKAAVEVKITRTAPEVKVVDETVKEPAPYKGQMPVDHGKRTVEVLPGIKLVVYSRGYVALKVKGKGWNGQKSEVGKPLYRDGLKVLVDALLAEIENTRTYEEANGIEPAAAFDEAAFHNVPF
jgi:hypothetical protein